MIPVVYNAFKSSFCINMAPTFLVSGDGHGFMNHTDAKGNPQTAKVSNDCVQEMCQSWACVMKCGVTYVNVSFHI